MQTAFKPAKPLMLFDGDCGFCRYWVERWRHVTADALDYEPAQSRARDFPEIPAEQFARSVYLIEPDGTTHSGARAVFGALALAPRGGFPLWAYEHIPGVGPITEAGYNVVANNRNFFSRLTRWLLGREAAPSTYFLTRWIFLRLIGVIYIIAFASFWVQAPGLIGSRGILPAADLLAAVKERFGSEGYHLFPTLSWLGASDRALSILCAAGLAGSLLATLNLFPALGFLVAWACYLSISVVGQTFLSFQWDILLLETGFLAIFFAPWQILPRLATEPAPSLAIHWLIRLLLFKLMFLSGAVKLLSGDSTWRDLTALKLHYETQPLPTWIGWYFHLLPMGFHRFSTLVMFAIELGAPFLIFLPRRPRLAAFILFVGFQILIAATGNYTFFNCLTVALCIPLLDDAYLRWLVPAWLKARLVRAQPAGRPLWIKPVLRGAFFIFIFTLSAIQFLGEFGFSRFPESLADAADWFQPFRISSGYGLFRVMTTERPEIILEGSNNGETWLPYEFKWKAGALDRRPGFVAPHPPRLDWQMWFAALGSMRQTRWFTQFMVRVLEGSPDVLKLLKTNPFPDSPPRYLRAELYEYNFTDRGQRRATGNWWRRERLGAYSPVLQLKSESRVRSQEEK